MKAVGTNLLFSTTYHPQTDGQIEKLNHCLKMYLQCMANPQLKTWAKWLVVAEWWYSTSYHTSLKITHFQALYGYPPPHFFDSLGFYSALPSVQMVLAEREEANKTICQQLLQAQSRTKQ